MNSGFIRQPGAFGEGLKRPVHHSQYKQTPFTLSSLHLQTPTTLTLHFIKDQNPLPTCPELEWLVSCGFRDEDKWPCSAPGGKERPAAAAANSCSSRTSFLADHAPATAYEGPEQYKPL